MAPKSETTPLLANVPRKRRASSPGVSYNNEQVALKKDMTMFGAVGVIFSLVVGNGIFISPIGITQYVGSVGLSLVIWAVCGVLNIMCALCYAELGAMITEPGGDYAFMYIGLGPLPAFLNMWLVVLVLAPANIAVLGRTMGTYLLKALDDSCYSNVVTILAIWVSLTFAYLNGRSVRASISLQNVFGMTKLVSLVFIVIIGIIQFGQGYTHNFDDAFKGSNTDVTSIGMGLFLGYFSFLGWDLPRAIWLAMLIVIAVFVAANVAYFSVLTPRQLVNSDAVVLDFVRRSLGTWAVWIMSILIALSCAGSVSVTLLTNSRYLFAAGKRNQLPSICCMISAKCLSPLPGIIILCSVSLLYCFISDVEMLMTYLLVTEQIRIGLSLTALLVLRWKLPHAERPVKVNLIMVVAILITVAFLLGISIYNSPVAGAVGLLIFIVGIPVYYAVETLKRKESAQEIMNTISISLQKLLMVVPEEVESSMDSYTTK